MAKQSQGADGALYESVCSILACEIPDEEKRAQMQTLGVSPTMLNAIHLAMGKKAAGGDVQAAKYLRDVVQEQGQDTSGEEGTLKFSELSTLTDQQLREMAAKWENR